MGIDIHGLHFLRYASRKRPLGETVTIGRQSLLVSRSDVMRVIGPSDAYRHDAYCEHLLADSFGAANVESIDYSGYEGATNVHDMNDPLPEDLRGRFDTVIDGGCLEHVFDAPQALENCSLLCRPGGQILHILPANNFCGHGFWQFSPELFFSLYSESNGYSGTEVFLADLTDHDRWFRVEEPKDGRRVTVHSSSEVYALVRTELRDARFSHRNVQQSDYRHEWDSGTPAGGPAETVEPSRWRRTLKGIPVLGSLLTSVHRAYSRRRSETGLNGRNPGLTEVSIRD